MGGATRSEFDRLVSFEQVLDGFHSAQARERESEALREPLLIQSGEELLHDYRSAMERWRASQERTADDFNLLRVMQVADCELIHSRVLAWLLARQIDGPDGLGTHAQGALGFKAFLAEIRLPATYADVQYWVRTEVRGAESIIDIEVGCSGRFLIHIENKIRSLEGVDQTRREWADVERRAARLAVPAANVHGFFLTLDGTQPKDRRFSSITWSRIASVFECFAELAEPPEVKLFCEHYARSMRLVSADASGKLRKEAEDVGPSFQ